MYACVGVCICISTLLPSFYQKIIHSCSIGSTELCCRNCSSSGAASWVLSSNCGIKNWAKPMKIEAFNRKILANPLINQKKMVYQWGFERDIEFLHEVEIYGMIRTSHLSLANIGSCYNPVILERFMHIIWFGKKAFEYVRYMLCLFLYTRPEDFEPAVLECVNHWPAEKDTATMANCSYVIAITDPGIKSSLPSHVQMSETTL